MERIRVSYQLMVVIILVIVGCNPGDTVTDGGTTGVINPTAPPPANIVCDPFSDESGMTGHGIPTSLYYLTAGQPQYTNVEDMINNGTAAGVNLYLNDINVPTRDFDRGFYTQSGQLLTDGDGNALYEWFALHMQSDIGLGPTDVPGQYQFAVLSDDGAIFSINDTGNGLRTLINNDGTHPTQMGCETDPITFTSSTKLPMQLDYYQGPRYQIAMQLLWRPYPTDPSQVTDPLCGQSGNYLFFDPDNDPSTPEQAYLDLVSRGWAPLTQANFFLPQAVGANNPCAAVNPNVISNVQITNLTETSATFTWTTTASSDSYVNIAAYPSTTYTLVGGVTQVTSHSVNVTGLTAFTVYSYYVSSTDGLGNQTASTPITFRTLR